MFYLRDEGELNEDAPGSRYELRRRFWAYALPVISGAFDHKGPFSNVSPSRENWINGSFGINGFYLCCVANYDSARVELVFSKTDKEENKRIFDAILLHKQEIEAALGASLEWDRGDEKISSKVYVQLPNVSIENEVDWLQMAQFHTEWCKKFHEVIVPYILQG